MIEWNSFKAKYDKREQWAFENMSYFLFCSENNCSIGLFRYKNQAGIETEPLNINGSFVGFQAKFYSNSIPQNKDDIIDSVKKAINHHPDLTKLLFYLNLELSEGKGKNKTKPQYQIDIEQYARQNGITIEWRVPSHIEFQLSQPQNKWIKNIFFGGNGLDPDFFNDNINKSVANLGARFNKKLNFELPIAQLFDTISHNEVFYEKLIKIIDDWTTDSSYRKCVENTKICEIESKFESIKKELLDWLKSFNYTLHESINISNIIDEISGFDEIIYNKMDDLFKEQSLNKSEQYVNDNEIHRLRELITKNNEFISEIRELHIGLNNHPCLIIRGEAGCGKSHLLGDIATKRQEQSQPTILLLGTNFKDGTIEGNILKKLDLTCKFKDFLSDLNEIGIKSGTRVLLMIDAINEGAGVNLWKNQIAGFIKEVMNYPAIGLVLTIRSTYYIDIIPNGFKTNESITIVEHKGFHGNEYEALKMFCDNYGLKAPNFPILTPEYSNPLFMHLVCVAAKDRADKNFPSGFNGVTNIYRQYCDKKNEDFATKRHEYKNRKIVSKAIAVISQAIYDSDYEALNLDDAFSLFDKEFPNFKDLLSDLIEECVIIKINDRYEELSTDIVVFSYQKLGDFYMAEELIKSYKTFEELKIAFKTDKRLKKLVDTHNRRYEGILEALSVLLPEKYDTELFEIIDCYICRDSTVSKYCKGDTLELFSNLLLDSLKWRDVKTINIDKIKSWISDNDINDDKWLFAILELSVIPGHPFNGDYLHELLSSFSMRERDSFWQQHIYYYKDKDDSGIAYPLRRLIDWAWTPGMSYRIDTETARLTAQTLAWVLSSTIIYLRDQTTKALVNLLEQQPNALIKTLKAFEKVDDFYITERLYAVAYGCTLKTEKLESIKMIAEYVYNTIFSTGQPPVHILLRDYARNIVEYAVYKNVVLDVNVALIRPPYGSDMPLLPGKKEVGKYYIKKTSKDSKYVNEHNAISNSLISGFADFGHYIVETACDCFSSISIKEDENYNEFYDSLKEKAKKNVDYLRKTINKLVSLEYLNPIVKSSYKQKIKSVQLLAAKCKTIDKLQKTLDDCQYVCLKTQIIPYLEKKAKDNSFNSWGARYWILKRVFELGYDKAIHGQYDHIARLHDDYWEYKMERIGKKYQWIAFYELLAYVADNYKLKDNWINDKFDIFKGTWQLSLRNIDPVYITRFTDDNKTKRSFWWNNDMDYYWEMPDKEWSLLMDDITHPQNIIQKTDNIGEKWLRLSYADTLIEPKQIGDDKYNYSGKIIEYHIQSYLIKQSDKNKLIRYLNSKCICCINLPVDNNSISALFNREKFWSPAYNDTYGNMRTWYYIKNTKYELAITNVAAKGLIDDDKSGANTVYNIPCRIIFDGLKLQYASCDGELKNQAGDLVVINKDNKGCLIKEQYLIDFLKMTGLDIIWSVEINKICKNSKLRYGATYFKIFDGVYSYNDNAIVGKLKVYDRAEL